MAKFRKQALFAGKYHSPDGVVESTPSRLKHWRESFRKLVSAGYSVPMDWDHQSTIEGITPLSADDYKKRQSSKNSVGRLTDIVLNASGNGATLEFEVSDPKAIERVERNEVYISPVIMDSWKDGAGTEHKDVFTHVDLVQHPVDYSQKPFERVEGAIACGLRMGLSESIYRMSEDNFGGGEDDDKDNETETPVTPEETENPDMPPDDKAGGEAEAIVAHLSELGVELPADWCFDTDAAGAILLASLKTASRAKRDSEAAPEPEEEESMTKPAATVADPGYAAMSLQTRTALDYAERMHRKEVTKRLDSLLESGRCLPVEYQDKKGSLSAVKLSLDAKGQPAQSKLEEWIDSREAVPAGTFWDPETRTKKMSVTAVPHPASLNGQEDESEAREVAKWALGGPKPTSV